MITVESASLQKAQRINDSIARNPTFSFDTPRFLTAYAETTFPLAFFVSNQTANTTLGVTLDNARSFFQDHKYPDGFYRRQAPYDFNEVSVLLNMVFDLVRVSPGYNDGVGNYIVNEADPGTVRRFRLSGRAPVFACTDVALDMLCIPTTGESDRRDIPEPDIRT